jgi:predicted DNA-binding transcriptional regulator YafY
MGSSWVERRPPRFLDALQNAVINGVQVRLGYADREGSEPREPFTLLASSPGPAWYLVANTEAGRLTFRIDRVSSVDPTTIPCTDPTTSTLPRAGARSPTRSTARESRSRFRRYARPTG